MTAPQNTNANSIEGKLYARQPQVRKMNKVAGLSGILKKRSKRTRSKSALEAELHPLTVEIADPPEHHSPRRERLRLWRGGSQVLGDQVSVDKPFDLKAFGKDDESDRALARTIWAADNEELWSLHDHRTVSHGEEYVSPAAVWPRSGRSMDPDQESKYRSPLQEATAQTRKRTTAVRFRQATSRSTETRLNASATVDYGEWAIQDSQPAKPVPTSCASRRADRRVRPQG